MSSCSEISFDDSTGPFGINYLRIYHCTFADYKFLGTLLLIAWHFYLISILGSTAANYFSPTLSSICDKLKIPFNIAGITLLAFGNGAPDVFSTMASFTSMTSDGETTTGKNLVGIGALLGGSMFVANVVVGAIAILCPCEVSRDIFFRDIIFHLFAVSCVTIIACTGGSVTLLTASLLFVLYFSYVLVVMAISYWNSLNVLTINLGNTITSAGSIQTAFWHHSRPKPKPARSSLSSLEEFEMRNTNYSADSYTFLTLNDGRDEGDELEMKSEYQSNDFETTINLAGAWGATFNSDILIEDYFGSEMTRAGMSDNIDTGTGIHMSPHQSTTIVEPLKERLLPHQSIEGHQQREEDCPQELSSELLNASRKQKESRGYLTALQAVYWQQKILSKSFRRSLVSSDFWGYPISQKLWIILEFPATFARDITIPNCDAATWNKDCAIVQPLAALVFVLFTTGLIDQSIGEIPIWAFSLLIGLPSGFLVFIFTYRNKPPQDWLFSNTWNMIGFFMSIVWIYAVAEELVTSLYSMGTIFNISHSFLGLTVLAWGNSIGDFFSNTALAKRGLGEMAIAGCYGGPVFNILVGLGLPFMYLTSKSYPAPISIELDRSAIMSLIFIYFSLISTMGIVYFRDCQIDKPFGIYLLLLYLVYNICQMFLLVV